MAATKQKITSIKVPSMHDWRTTDTDEINKRRLRAREEAFTILNLDPQHPIFSNFQVKSGSGLTYSVEIRDFHQGQSACDCVDFRINGLGTCKHVEAVLLHLQARFRRLFKAAQQNSSSRIEVVVDPAEDTLRVSNGNGKLAPRLQKWFEAGGRLRNGSPEKALTALQQMREDGSSLIRISQEIAPWLENRRRAAERIQLRRQYELKVQSGEWPSHETKVPLFPYQREGMLHLAFTERALLADEMGLGKTIQAIAACALLRRMGQAQHALIVTPASLKTEWEEQIQRFSDMPFQILFGARPKRLRAYSEAPFFTIVNYEQMLTDTLEVNARLRPDIVVLDEAQRIKNWGTKTAQAVKRLKSRYAFVLTGTPIENRIDELHSLMDFLNPSVLGPLFRFNRDFYQLDERGRPSGYRNLGRLHARIKPYMLRRRKAEVETELPERTDRNHFVPLGETQKQNYGAHEQQVAKMIQIAKRRPLTQQEQEKLLRELAMMRMTCDTNYILDESDRACPKLAELEKVIEECGENDAKVIVFSEWERMLELVRELCQRLNIGFAWHTGRVPQQRRRAEINTFKNDPGCRVFLSTDSGSTGLNLQAASVVINCDLPWNPAKLEQRIARAWRKHQTRPVTVINLVAENTIEHRMLDTLSNKQALADAVLDLKGNLDEIKLRGGKQAFLARLQQLMGPGGGENSKFEIQNLKLEPPPFNSIPADRPLAFAQRVRDAINGAFVRCEERYPNEGAHSVLLVVVDGSPALYRPRVEALHEELFGKGQSDPLSPVQLELIDRGTDEALQRLLAAGLITSATRATRPLDPSLQAGFIPPLSASERAKVDDFRRHAARKLKMAHLLGEGGLAEEGRPALLEAALHLARAFAMESRFPEPVELDDALLPPLSTCWKETLPQLRSFAADPTQNWKPLAEGLSRL